MNAQIISWPLVKFVMLAALRDRLVLSMLLILLVGVSLSIFLGSAAIIEQNRFALVFAAGGLRFAGVTALVLFTVFHVRRSFETKDVEYLLSRPVSRIAFLVSHFTALTILALLFAVSVLLVLFGLSGGTFTSGYFLWWVSLFAEFMIMANMALFLSMVLPSAASGALAAFAFYILGRLVGQIFGILDAHIVGEFVQNLGYGAEFISYFIPRLDLMAQTSWLVYGPDPSVDCTFILLRGAFFTLLVLAASIIDLLRRQF